MKALLIAGATLAGIVATVLLVGLLLPVAHRASGSRIVGGTRDEVWGALTDVEAHPRWRDGLERVERLPPVDGHPAWREHGRDGPLTLVEMTADPPRRWVTRIAPGGPFGGTWTYELEAAGAGTRVTITEDGEIYNPVFRFVGRLFLDMSATLNGVLDALERRFPPGAS